MTDRLTLPPALEGSGMQSEAAERIDNLVVRLGTLAVILVTLLFAALHYIPPAHGAEAPQFKPGAGFSVSVSPAAQPLPDKPIFVTGKLDCGEWLASRQKNTSVVIEGYVLGVLNGLVMGTGREFWHATEPGISQDAVYFSIDGYCKSHPTDQVNTAITTLFQERAK